MKKYKVFRLQDDGTLREPTIPTSDYCMVFPEFDSEEKALEALEDHHDDDIKWKQYNYVILPVYTIGFNFRMD